MDNIELNNSIRTLATQIKQEYTNADVWVTWKKNTDSTTPRFLFQEIAITPEPEISELQEYIANHSLQEYITVFPTEVQYITGETQQVVLITPTAETTLGF